MDLNLLPIRNKHLTLNNKEGIMKRNQIFTVLLVVFLIFIEGKETFAAKTLFDDFSSGTTIDSQKWEMRENVREVIGGKLVSKLGNNTYTGRYTNHTRIKHANLDNIVAIQSEVTLIDVILDTGTDAYSIARIGGRFYNANGGGTAVGDILAAVYLGDQGSGIEAFWAVLEALDETGDSWEEKGSGTLPIVIDIGTPYILRVEYDGTNEFEFEVSGVTAQFDTAPMPAGPAVTKFKGLSTEIRANNGTATGYVSAEYDDVFIDTGSGFFLHDDFTSAPIDQTKWDTKEIVREISGQELRLNMQSIDQSDTISINPRAQITPIMEARVLVEGGSTVSTGANAHARIANVYYNETRGPGSGQAYNQTEDNIFVFNAIQLKDDGTLEARCLAVPLDEFGSTTATSLFNHKFSSPISFDTFYTLSIEFTGDSIICKCDGEAFTYDILTPTYPPYGGQSRKMQSRVNAELGENGYMKSRMDDVYTGYLTAPVYDITGSWEYTIDSAETDCPSGPAPGDIGILSITQGAGGGITLIDDEGRTYTGSINGTYVALFTLIQDPSETLRLWDSFILSSATTATGTVHLLWSGVTESCSGDYYFTLTKQLPDISVSPTSVNFGDVTEGSSSSAEIITISNIEVGDLHVGSITITGTGAASFSLDLTGGVDPIDITPAIIPTGSDGTLTVTFNPTSTGTRNASLVITSNDPDEPTVTVTLTGNGVASGGGRGTGGGGGGGGGCFISTISF
jgi:hypothetical protein